MLLSIFLSKKIIYKFKSTTRKSLTSVVIKQLSLLLYHLWSVSVLLQISSILHPPFFSIISYLFTEMSSKSEKDRAKQIQDRCQNILIQLLKDEDNKYCVDCDAKGEYILFLFFLLSKRPVKFSY